MRERCVVFSDGGRDYANASTPLSMLGWATASRLHLRPEQHAFGRRKSRGLTMGRGAVRNACWLLRLGRGVRDMRLAAQ